MNNKITHYQIVEAADLLFYSHGFDHTSFSDIAGAVKISRGSACINRIYCETIIMICQYMSYKHRYGIVSLFNRAVCGIAARGVERIRQKK
ncbi:MAG: TetR/AcrR family transcriptional regulator [bacterium]|nr:TetR/AcrR family transcriptional regulator [bacterium]